MADEVGTPKYYKNSEYIEQVRAYIETFSEELQHIKGEVRLRRIREIIRNYLDVVSDGLIRDEQFKNKSGAYNKEGAYAETVASITGYGILTRFLDDARYDEIQVNGREVWVEQNGLMAPALDENGNRIQFNSVEDQTTVFSKLLAGTGGRMSKSKQLVNGRTERGYRVAVVDKSVHSPDPKKPYDAVYASAVIRKFSDVRLSLSFMITLGGKIKSGSCDIPGTFSDNMGKFCKTFTRAWISWITSGPTASGKTTTNSGILEWAPDDMRFLLVQNPSEINMRKYVDVENGDFNLLNNVIHLESMDDNPEAASEEATLTNIMNHSLRLSPVYVVIGEARTDMEFKILIQKISLAGHPFNTTGHAGTPEGTISRLVSAVLGASPNLPLRLVMENIAEALDLIVVQRKQIDKSRRVLYITEVLGVTIDGTAASVKLNNIFEWKVFKEADYCPETGRVLRINGWHVRTSKISEKLVTKYQNFGVHSNEYEFLLGEPTEDEVETYSGMIQYDPKRQEYEVIPEEFYEAARRYQGKSTSKESEDKGSEIKVVGEVDLSSHKEVTLVEEVTVEMEDCGTGEDFELDIDEEDV
jgi:pilus assembly protein CpaF